MPINSEDYNCLDYNTLVSNKTRINEYFNESDTQKKESLVLLMSENSKNIIEILPTMQLLYDVNLHHLDTQNLFLHGVSKMYRYL